MKVKLGFRLALLTGMLLLLVSTFKTQPAACSPCTDACYNSWVTCIENGHPTVVCNEIKDACKSRCTDD